MSKVPIKSIWDLERFPMWETWVFFFLPPSCSLKPKADAESPVAILSHNDEDSIITIKQQIPG